MSMSEDNPKYTHFDQRNQQVNQQANVVGDAVVNQAQKSEKDLNNTFQAALNQVDESDLDNDTKSEMNEAIKMVEEEVAKGDKANASLVNTLLLALVDRLPSIAEVLLAAILDPALGAVSGIRILAKEILGTSPKGNT